MPSPSSSRVRRLRSTAWRSLTATITPFAPTAWTRRGVGDLAEPLHLVVPPRERVARTDHPGDPEAQLGVQVDQLEELVALVAGADDDDRAAEPTLRAGSPEPRAVQPPAHGEQEPGEHQRSDRRPEAEPGAEAERDEQGRRRRDRGGGSEPRRSRRRAPRRPGSGRGPADRDHQQEAHDARQHHQHPRGPAAPTRSEHQRRAPGHGQPTERPGGHVHPDEQPPQAGRCPDGLGRGDRRRKGRRFGDRAVRERTQPDRPVGPAGSACDLGRRCSLVEAAAVSSRLRIVRCPRLRASLQMVHTRFTRPDAGAWTKGNRSGQNGTMGRSGRFSSVHT